MKYLLIKKYRNLNFQYESNLWRWEQCKTKFSPNNLKQDMIQKNKSLRSQSFYHSKYKIENLKSNTDMNKSNNE